MDVSLDPQPRGADASSEDAAHGLDTVLHVLLEDVARIRQARIQSVERIDAEWNVFSTVLDGVVDAVSKCASVDQTASETIIAEKVCATA